MPAARTDAEETGRAIRKTQEVDSEIGKGGETEAILAIGFTDEINPYFCRVKVMKKVLNPDGFYWGTGSWYDDWNDVASLVTEYYPVSVYNDDNCFLEPLNDNKFIGSASTATMDYVNNTISLGSGDYVVSEIIGLKPGADILSTRFEVITGSYALDESTVYLSNDTGSNWEEYTEGYGNEHYFTTTGSELMYKIIAGSDNQYVNNNEDLLLFKIVYNN